MFNDKCYLIAFFYYNRFLSKDAGPSLFHVREETIHSDFSAFVQLSYIETWAFIPYHIFCKIIMSFPFKVNMLSRSLFIFTFFSYQLYNDPPFSIKSVFSSLTHSAVAVLNAIDKLVQPTQAVDAFFYQS